MKRVGAVVVFAEGITKEQAEVALEALAASGAFVVESTEIREYDDRAGHPVFYVP